MSKFGTGAAESIWTWWSDLHKKTFRDEKNEFLAYVQLIIPFVITLIGMFFTGILDAIVEFFEWIGGLFNQTDDDQARDFIEKHNCQQINTLSDDKMVSMINSMLDGPTGDDDENAILKLLRCLPCDRLHTIVNRVGLSNLQSNIDGSEYDELQVLLGNCGVINFSSWDDDATRLFIGRASCQQLNALSVQSLHQLLINLFEGSTGDEDEQSINKVMGCIDCAKIQQILNINGTRWEDFDDEIQGSEWTDFKNILQGRCGIHGN